MKKHSKSKEHRKNKEKTKTDHKYSYDPSSLSNLPETYQDVINYFVAVGECNPFLLRKETMMRIERITGSPIICYVARTHNLPRNISSAIEDYDLTGFNDLITNLDSGSVDIFLVSNGGSAEAAERIVDLVRNRFSRVRFIIPRNAFSAATLICLSGDTIIMCPSATLGPIDPQIYGIPARSILRAFETVEKKLKEEGPSSLTAYMPLISKYDLHIFELCKSAEELSKELAKTWLNTYMFKSTDAETVVLKIVEVLADFDTHKSHGRSINRNKAKDLGLNITNIENITGLRSLVESLFNQYEFFFDKTSFYKLFENTYGISWGRQVETVNFQIPQPDEPLPPSPGKPRPTG